MSDVAIQVGSVGKQYKIGQRERYKTLRDSLTDAFAALFRRIAERSFSSNDGGQQGDDNWIWALKDVSFEVKRGEAVGIIGRNGAGKSTLLKVISRITEPTEGEVIIRGRVGSLLEVGTGFHPELTGRENIFLNGAILGMKRAEIERKLDEMVAFAEVEKFIDTPVKHYSSGMYVRLAFAVAAHLEPEILLVDEVLAVGDAEFQKKCLGKMRDIAGEGRTVIFVSHNMAAVERLCHRAILLENGKIVQDGVAQQIVAAYLRSGIQQRGERVWTDRAKAPGNNVARLRGVRALNAENQVAHEFKVTESFRVETEFWVLAPDYRLDVSLYFYSESGTLVFVAGDFQSNTWRNSARSIGVHRSICHVPANLLNEGMISILVGVSTPPYTLHAIERDAISLWIVDDLEPGGARGHYTRAWPGGVVRPLLQWVFDYKPLENT